MFEMKRAAVSGSLGGIRVGDRYPVRIIGAINLTKNSFYSGSVRQTPDSIIRSAIEMEEQGADIIDLGARSTAPYRKYDIPPEVEKRILTDALGMISNKVNIPISVDTTRYEPAKAAIEKGAGILNDVYGLSQKDAKRLCHLVASRGSSLLLTAHEARRRKFPDPIRRVSEALERGISLAVSEGVGVDQITIDPGIGFFPDKNISNIEWNTTVLARLAELRKFNRPICIGLSRKRFIGQLIGEKPAEARLNGSISATAISVYNGAHIIRTHDVKETWEAVKVSEAIREKSLKLTCSSRPVNFAR